MPKTKKSTKKVSPKPQRLSKGKSKGNGGKTKVKSKSDNLRLSLSHSYVGSARVADTDVPGSTVFMWQLTPSTIRDRWFSAQAALYERWRPEKMTIHLTSGLSALVNGMLGVGWVPDVGDIDNNEPLAYFMSLKHLALGNIRDGIHLKIPTETEFKWLDTDPTTPNAHHGSLVIFVASPIGGLTGEADVVLHLDGSFLFNQPRVPVSIAGGGGELIRISARAGGATVSGRYLAAFVEEHGPSKLNFGVVYELDPPMDCNNQEGVAVACAAVVRTGAFTKPEAFLFPTIAGAERFAKSQTGITLIAEGLMASHLQETEFTGYGLRPVYVPNGSVLVQVQPIARVDPPVRTLPTVALAGSAVEELINTFAEVLKQVSSTRTFTGELELDVGGVPGVGTVEGLVE